MVMIFNSVKKMISLKKIQYFALACSCVINTGLETLHAQDNPISDTNPTKVFSKIEILCGTSVLAPTLDSIYLTVYYDNNKLQKTSANKTLKIGYLFGMALSHSLTKKFEINSRILFKRKGHKGSFTETWQITPPMFITGSNTFNVNSDYISFSIIPKYALGRKNRISIGLGGFWNYLLRSNFEINYFEGNPNKDVRYSQTKEYKKYDAGLSLNIEHDFRIKKNIFLNVQLLGNYGLVNTFDRPLYNDKRNFDIRSQASSSVRNNSVSLIVGILKLLDRHD